MKLAAFSSDGRNGIGVVTGEELLDLTAAWPALAGAGGGRAPESIIELLNPDGLAALSARLSQASGAATRRHVHLLDRVQLHAPLPQTGKVLCVASNYAAHIAEAGREAPVDRHKITPWLFLKPATSIIGPGEPIPLPRTGQAIDWEVELAAVIGRRGRYVPVERALDIVSGYTIVNDISERRFKVPEGRPKRDFDAFFDWLHGKWFDGFAPMGPWVVTADEIPDPQSLAIELRVDGRVRQQGSTGEMIYPVAELVAFASSIMTLLPGDVIATGTPHGVGAATGEFLKPGATVECRVERIGTLVNPVVAE